LPTYRKPKKSDWQKSLIFIGVYVAVISITAFYLLVTYWYLWIALVAGGLIILILWHAKSTAYHCPICGSEFEISVLTDFLSPHGVTKNGGWLYLKCPVCSNRSKMQVLVKTKDNSNPVMETVGYSEWVPAGYLIKGLMGMFSAVIVFVTLLLCLQGRTVGEDFWGLAFGWGILAFVLFLFWNYRGLRIQISSSRLFVTYGLFNQKSFLLNDIVSCERIKASFGRYLGVGVRYGFDGSLAYTTSFGDAVMVVPKRGRTFVFSSNKPDHVCKILRTTF